MGVYNPSVGMYVYVDGELAGSLTVDVPASIYNSTIKLTIGCNYNGSTYDYNFDGYGGLFKIVTTVLIADRIKSIYQKERHLFGV